jgi:hypothetical protein
VHLSDILDDADTKRRFLADGVRLVDEEVARKGGLSGMALKAGYATIKRVKPDIVESALGTLLPRFAPAIEPKFAAAQASGDVAGWFAGHAEEVADALLAVTDERAEHADNPIVRKTYQSLRGQARQHTVDAVPAVGRLLARYTH